ncbi:MAG: signal peptidase I [Candidatus Nealsonbacteria bacterium CG_4_10_14_0_8_um_filter_35_10]|uniref:Signal peptidase I n=2 Tax=Candidatus Nealsoniibacteriota TaxID=1817911 RepID=A0A2M7R8V7_9BACT|nr:MAG: signal peptidase I [Parcubacteria group bacterium CG1_02_36_42]PIY90983.1 MAG: signal peptidase I [Candidatus Nealsonbacteria bacterium CG_4_10_14_0_8_um_filter_35_10]PJB99354.1 MAG: signal peptidase I [Candidatus Nealsonbacteria bacterium CG_4_9_14_0_8_um_filter_35_12]
MINLKNFFQFWWEILKIVILALIIVIPIRYFLFQPFLVKGQSMEPNFHDDDYLIIDEISYRFREPKRGEVIVFKYPRSPSQRFIKRVIGLPGETIEIKDGKVIIIKDDKAQILDESNYLSPSLKTSGNLKITLNQNEYFVLGDNRLVSADSRSWGTLPKKYITGRVIFRAWPITALAFIEEPKYQF